MTTYQERLEDVPHRVRLDEVTGAPDPRELYARLQLQWGPVAPVDLEPGVPAWLVLGHREVSAVLRNELLFSRDSRTWRYVAEHGPDPASAVLGLLAPRENAYYVDGAHHRRLRAAIDDALAELDESRLARTTSATAHAVLDRLASRAEVDLVRDYAVEVPVQVLGEVLGLSLVDAARMRDLVQAQHRGLEAAQEASDEQLMLLVEHVAAHRAEPAGDLTASLIDRPTLANDIEVQAAIALLFTIGQEAGTAWIASVLHALLTDEAFVARFQGGRIDFEGALDEVSRTTPPMTHVLPRFALSDCELGGRLVARGDAVVPALAAANTDQAVHATSEPWLEADNRFHLTWGAGAHACPAHRAATIITRTAVEVVLHRAPEMGLTVEPGAIGMTPSPWTRRPSRLPVLLRAA
ncbi:cytochrome P450 [Antribacter gilvus]|uniref:cytochrome P450 n=1 Tax=Antribacter gilvus TaxID=2304675 RepID=UPI000F7AC10C|nr:cytochrome P450 [Antribacter gilvus]